MRSLTNLTRISDWPFALKMGMCPALAMLALLGLAFHGIYSADQQARLIRSVVAEDLTRAEQLAKSAGHLQQINGRLYRLTSLQAAGTADLAIDHEVAELVEQTEALAMDLSRQTERSADGELLPLVAELR